MTDLIPHVFITQGDITHLACDAWLVSTDARRHVARSFTDGVPGLGEAIDDLSEHERSRLRDNKAVPVLVGQDGPTPVLTPVPLYGVDGPEDYEPAITSFVTSAVESLGTWRARKGPLPLLAMPAFGIGRGGAEHIPGSTLQALLQVAAREGRANDVDIVIVLREPGIDFIQARRREDPARWWPSLSPDQREHAARLGAKAGAGELVPFLGAGVSASAGAPKWDELLENLAKLVGLAPSDYGRNQFSLLDQAEIISAAFADQRQGDFRRAIAEEVNLKRYGLLPAMVASLKVRQAITLNYDCLLELASADIGKAVTVLPWNEVRKDSPWLLKLHGTVEDPDTIVLTRDDYLGYSADRGALSAIVKALLFTHELLFVGFGLTDDHFHAIAYEVRKALPSSEHAFGTAVVPKPNPQLEAVWRKRVEVIPIERDPTADFDSATRLVEIFMDCLLCHASTSQSYLLRDGYEDVLSSSEIDLRQKVLEFVSAVHPEEAKTPAWTAIRQVLDSLGYPAESGPLTPE